MLFALPWGSKGKNQKENGEAFHGRDYSILGRNEKAPSLGLRGRGV
jgi:hypothetical protein